MLPILEHSSPLLPQTLPPATDTLKSSPTSLTTHRPVLTPLPHLFSPTRTIKDAWSLPSASLPPHTHTPTLLVLPDSRVLPPPHTLSLSFHNNWLSHTGKWKKNPWELRGACGANEGVLVALLRLGSPHRWPSHQFLPENPPEWPDPSVPTEHFMVQGKPEFHFSRQHALTGTLLKHTCS